MAATQEGAEEWDKSTDEIHEMDSEDLCEARPNRWKGPESSWRTLTEEDRLNWTALESLRNQDLSIHLYDAFALKQPPGAAADRVGLAIGQDIDTETGRAVEEHDWVPPPVWTAWPMRANLVPGDDFIKETEDENMASTFRRAEARMPSTQLEEVVTATILRHAKERFRKRDFSGAAQSRPERQPSQGADAEPGGGAQPEAPTSEADDAGPSSDVDMAIDASSEAAPPSGQGSARDGSFFTPTVSTDDDWSYRLLRPSTRHILERLDKTLLILHNARIATLDHGARRAAHGSGDGEAAGDEDDAERTRPKSRGRPPGRAASSEPEASDDAGADIDTAAEAERPRKRRSSRTLRRSSARGDGDDADVRKEETLAGRALRDWSEVVGAAALAGFSPEVIARTRERCSKLFGEGMDLLALDETARMPGHRNAKHARDIGVGIRAASPLTGDEDEARLRVRQARALGRPADRRPSVSMEPAANPRCCPYPGCPRATTPFTRRGDVKRHIKEVHSNGEAAAVAERSKSPVKRRTRSESSGPVAAKHYCPHPGCPRAVRPFGRTREVKRHLRFAHNGEGPEDISAAEDSEDEMYGAVHVDGFLKPIRPRRGWRGDVTDSGPSYPARRQSEPPSSPRTEEGVDDDEKQEEGEEEETVASSPLTHVRVETATDEDEDEDEDGGEEEDEDVEE